MDSTGSGNDPVADPCEHGNETPAKQLSSSCKIPYTLQIALCYFGQSHITEIESVSVVNQLIRKLYHIT